jgi:hypothetical protein
MKNVSYRAFLVLSLWASATPAFASHEKYERPQKGYRQPPTFEENIEAAKKNLALLEDKSLKIERLLKQMPRNESIDEHSIIAILSVNDELQKKIKEKDNKIENLNKVLDETLENAKGSVPIKVQNEENRRVTALEMEIKNLNFENKMLYNKLKTDSHSLEIEGLKNKVARLEWENQQLSNKPGSSSPIFAKQEKEHLMNKINELHIKNEDQSNIIRNLKDEKELLTFFKDNNQHTLKEYCLYLDKQFNETREDLENLLNKNKELDLDLNNQKVAYMKRVKEMDNHINELKRECEMLNKKIQEKSEESRRTIEERDKQIISLKDTNAKLTDQIKKNQKK